MAVACPVDGPSPQPHSPAQLQKEWRRLAFDPQKTIVTREDDPDVADAPYFACMKERSLWARGVTADDAREALIAEFHERDQYDKGPVAAVYEADSTTR